jgi:hypothetical protein
VKYLFATLGVIAVAAGATGVVSYRVSYDPALHAAAAHGDALEWLRTDFHLDNRQFAAIQALHAAYSGTCAEHCRRIQEATRLRQALLAEHSNPDAVAAANRQLQDLRSTCETALDHHLRQVAALMSPEDGRRYLALVLPKIATFDHRAAPDLRLNSSP